MSMKSLEAIKPPRRAALRWSSIFIGLFTPAVVAAQVITLEVPLGTFGSVSGYESALTEWISSVYIFLVSAVGIIAAAMIMLNGLRWAAAAGNAEQVGVAKDGVVSASIGLVLALTSFIILNQLNPAFTVLQDAAPATLSFYDVSDAEDSGSCQSQVGNAGDSTCTGVQALDTTNMVANLGSTDLKLRPTPAAAAESMAAAFRAEFGRKLPVNHAFRSIEYQRCLYENNKGDNPAAPCSSPHNGGAALDLPQASMTQEEYDFLACGDKTGCTITDKGKTSGGTAYQRVGSNPWGFRVWNYNPDKNNTPKLTEQHHWDYPGQSSPSAACPGQC